MADVNNLGLKEDVAGIDIPDEVPEQRGEFAPNPYPGWFAVELPPDISGLWEVQEVKDPRNPQGETKVQRVQLVFTAEGAPLTVLQAHGQETIYGAGTGMGGKVSNVERRRGKKDEKDAPLVSDMYYFGEELGHDMDRLRAALRAAPGRANHIWIEHMNEHGGGRLKVKVSWSARCDENRKRYVWEANPETGLATGGTVEDPSGDKGCGAKFYLKDIPKDENSRYMERFMCPKCQTAVLRAWPQFDSFRRLTPEEEGAFAAAQ